jgi:hypothetical protein
VDSAQAAAAAGSEAELVELAEEESVELLEEADEEESSCLGDAAEAAPFEWLSVE